MTTLETVLGFDTSDKAKFRFHVLCVFYKTGWQGVHIAFPQLGRATLYRWKKTYESSYKRLNSLVPLSTRPKTTRTMQTPLPLLALIRSLRETYPRMGKAKVKLFVDAFGKREGLPSLSVSTIGKVIQRNNFFFAPKARRKMDQSYRRRIKLCPPSSSTPLGYLQLDGCKFYYFGTYYYFLTAVEIVTKQAWVSCVPTLKSKHAASFLQEVLSTSYVKVHTIQTDNGSEFKKYFEEAAKDAKLLHLFTYPRHPKTNGYVERFNWTVQDEFLHVYEDLIENPVRFEEALTQWVVYYNTKRPHQSLNYMTPYQFAKEKGGICLKSM